MFLMMEMINLVKHGKTIVDNDKYIVYENECGNRYLHGKDNKFNMYFRKSDGFTAKWGETFEEDPAYNPYGNEIADIEITKRCKGIRNAEGIHTPCPWCFPAGTMITMSDGSKKPIEEIKVSDNNLSMQFFKSGNRFCEGDVKKIFERDYEGDLIIIEL